LSNDQRLTLVETPEEHQACVPRAATAEKVKQDTEKGEARCAKLAGLTTYSRSLGIIVNS
jgi:hypothetical protein